MKRSTANEEISPNHNPQFCILALQHTLYILVFHLLQGFTPQIATNHWHDSIIDAGYIAGIPPLMVSGLLEIY